MGQRVRVPRPAAVAALIAALAWGAVGLSFAATGGRGADPDRAALAAEGQALFRAKGCVTCHAHAAAPPGPGIGVHIGPDLTGYRGSPEFLRRWLKDPPAVNPRTQMPNLGLRDDEIETLIAFLLQPREQ